MELRPTSSAALITLHVPFSEGASGAPPCQDVEPSAAVPEARNHIAARATPSSNP